MSFFDVLDERDELAIDVAETTYVGDARWRAGTMPPIHDVFRPSVGQTAEVLEAGGEELGHDRLDGLLRLLTFLVPSRWEDGTPEVADLAEVSERVRLTTLEDDVVEDLRRSEGVIDAIREL